MPIRRYEMQAAPTSIFGCTYHGLGCFCKEQTVCQLPAWIICAVTLYHCMDAYNQTAGMYTYSVSLVWSCTNIVCLSCSRLIGLLATYFLFRNSSLMYFMYNCIVCEVLQFQMGKAHRRKQIVNYYLFQ